MNIKCYYKLICLVIFCILLTSPCLAENNEQQIITLSNAIEIALRNHPAIDAQTGQVLSAKAKTKQAWGSLYPQVNITSEYSVVRSDNTQPDSTLSYIDIFDHNDLAPDFFSLQKSNNEYAATANISLLIWDFGKTYAQIKSQNFNAEATQLELRNTGDQVIFNVKESYFGLLSSLGTRDVAVEAVTQYNKHYEYARAQFEVGAKPKFDVTKAEVDLSNAKVELIKAENAVRLAAAVLNNAIGLPPQTGNYKVEEDSSSPWTENSYEDAKRLAFEGRPDLLSLRKQKLSAMESIKAAKRTYYPVLNSSANLTVGGTDETQVQGWSAGLNLKIPIFTGLTTYYQVAETQANLRVATANERTLKQTIFLELEKGFLALRESSELIKSTETSVKQARENLELANERYSAGLAIAVEVTDAVVSYSNARMSNITAHYNYKIAQAQIEKAMGGAYK